MPKNAKLIAANIVSLGFELAQVKYLINSHAHFDHFGGLSELKRLTGAQLLASKPDAAWLEKGLYPGSDEPSYYSIPVAVDEIIQNGEDLKLGENVLTAHITSWVHKLAKRCLRRAGELSLGILLWRCGGG